ncbi:MAG: LysM peptidoglycan-binding domain-containing protein [Chloroflexi bacterium]|nr:LysM peptidoglycan-binding domain-containing protein [Chloroflexota bacterium]
MADRDFLTAFNDCIDRLAAGQSLDDCLRRYPQYARTLRPLLEAGLTVRRARVHPAEVSLAQARVRDRVALAARTLPAQRRAYPLRALATLAASLVIVFFLATGGAAIVAQSSLPGDPLYGLKRLTETVRLSFSSNSQLAAEFAARRVDETRQLLMLNRAADVNFTGEVNAITEAAWVVAGLPVSVPSGTPGAAGIRAGDMIEVRGYTTTGGELVAREIILLEPGEREPVPTATPVPTRPPATATLPPSSTPAPTITAQPSTTLTPTGTPTRTPSPTLTPTGCIPAPPGGWTLYTVQAGDTLSALAAARGVTLAEMMRVNCITNPSLIVAGQRFYLPPGPDPVRPTTAPALPTVSSDTPGGDNPPVVNPPPDDNSNDNDDDSDNSGSDDHSGSGGGNDNN